MGKNSKVEKRSIAATSEPKIDPSLASLFDSSFGAVQAPQKAARRNPRANDNDGLEGVTEPPSGSSGKGFADLLVREEKNRKRKRPDDNEDIEDFHLKRLHDSWQVAGERRRRKTTETEAGKEGKGEEGGQDVSDEGGSSEGEGEGGKVGEEGDGDEDDEREDSPQKHEALTKSKEVSELEKSARTVFLGNVPSIAVSSKSYKTLKAHFKTAGKIVSIRFRSIAFSEQIPRKAAFVTHKFHEKQQTMNAYVVYSTSAEAREALKLNGSTVLDRHIRVDSVAHPAPHDSKRCVFIGNLDFEAQEENLWRHFAACGKVESVRVVRDPKTNVGKGFAYVQFEDPTSVEQALLLDGKKMANDRKLRVTRAKNLKRNQLKKPERRPDSRTRPGQKNVYVPKVDPKKRDTLSRAHKLLGRAGAAQLKSQSKVFEGLRATAQTDTGIKKGGSGKKKTGRARARAAARTAAWKHKSIKKSL